jgi:hypothetical protein
MNGFQFYPCDANQTARLAGTARRERDTANA